MPVVLIVTGFNATERATQELRERVRERHGTVVDAIELWTARSVVPRDGTSEPFEIVRRSGDRIASTVRTAAA
jgi:hypothetical protein